MKKIIINTLGPVTTDSYRATRYWIKKNGIADYKIKMHDSFEQIFTRMKSQEYIVMPVGYVNRNSEKMSSWVDFHFRYINDIIPDDVFTLHTKPMALVENVSYKKRGVVIQSSTYQLAKNTLKTTADEYIYTSSKSKALQLFLKSQYHFTICSKELITKYDSTNYRILQEFRPVMIWVVYRIKNTINQ